MIGRTSRRPLARSAITRSQIAQWWLNVPCSVTFFSTIGSRLTPTGSLPHPDLGDPAGRPHEIERDRERLADARRVHDDVGTEAILGSRPFAGIADDRGASIRAAISSRRRSRSRPTTITSAPLRRASAAHRMPIGPGPSTTTRSAGFNRVFSITALNATAHGSARQACSNGRLSGTRWRQRAGTRTYCVMAPLTP